MTCSRREALVSLDPGEVDEGRVPDEGRLGDFQALGVEAELRPGVSVEADGGGDHLHSRPRRRPAPPRSPRRSVSRTGRPARERDVETARDLGQHAPRSVDLAALDRADVVAMHPRCEAEALLREMTAGAGLAHRGAGRTTCSALCTRAAPVVDLVTGILPPPDGRRHRQAERRTGRSGTDRDGVRDNQPVPEFLLRCQAPGRCSAAGATYRTGRP